MADFVYLTGAFPIGATVGAEAGVKGLADYSVKPGATLLLARSLINVVHPAGNDDLTYIGCAGRHSYLVKMPVSAVVNQLFGSRKPSMPEWKEAAAAADQDADDSGGSDS